MTDFGGFITTAFIIVYIIILLFVLENDEDGITLMIPITLSFLLVYGGIAAVNNFQIQNSDIRVIRIESYPKEYIIVSEKPYQSIVYLQNTSGLMGATLLIDNQTEYELVKNKHFNVVRKIHTNIFGFEVNGKWDIVDSNVNNKK